MNAPKHEIFSLNVNLSRDNTNYIRGVHIFGILSSLSTLILLSIAVDENKLLYDANIHYDGTPIDPDTDKMVPRWMLLGIVVSVVGLALSTAALILFIVNKKIKYPLIETITFSLLSIAFLVYVTIGAINTNIEDCFTWSGSQRLRCSAPKAAQFFAFIGLMTCIFALSNGAKQWWKNKYPKPSSNNSKEVDSEVNDEMV